MVHTSRIKAFLLLLLQTRWRSPSPKPQHALQPFNGSACAPRPPRPSTKGLPTLLPRPPLALLVLPLGVDALPVSFLERVLPGRLCVRRWFGAACSGQPVLRSPFGPACSAKPVRLGLFSAARSAMPVRHSPFGEARSAHCTFSAPFVWGTVLWGEIYTIILNRRGFCPSTGYRPHFGLDPGGGG